MDAVNLVMLATAEGDVGLASFEGMTAAGQDAADSLGVTARDAVTGCRSGLVYAEGTGRDGPRLICGRADTTRPSFPILGRPAGLGGLFL